MTHDLVFNVGGQAYRVEVADEPAVQTIAVQTIAVKTMAGELVAKSESFKVDSREGEAE